MSGTTHDTYEHLEKTAANEIRQKKGCTGETTHGAINTIQQDQRDTWVIPHGETMRQIDYIVINRRYRNSVTKERQIPGKRERKHGTTKTTCNNTYCNYAKAITKYRKNIIPGTGAAIKYDLKALRNNAKKLEKGINKGMRNKRTPAKMGNRIPIWRARIKESAKE